VDGIAKAKRSEVKREQRRSEDEEKRSGIRQSKAKRSVVGDTEMRSDYLGGDFTRFTRLEDTKVQAQVQVQV
jgi:hypothetical protein